MHATLKGRVRWQVLDERGVPEIPRTPSGIPVGPAEGVKQDNLITNLGLDHIGLYSIYSTIISSNAARRYLAVGTGSAAPSNTDTTLDNEAQRASDAGAFPVSNQTMSLDTDNDLWVGDFLETRIVTMNTDRNLTEFGLSPSNSADIGIRELLRDSGGNPIPVTLLDGKSLRVDHTYTITLPAPANGIATAFAVDEYDAGNNLIQSIPYDLIHGGWVTALNHDSLLRLFMTWAPVSTFITNALMFTSNQSYNRVGNISGAPTVTRELVPYVPGSHESIKRFTFNAGQYNTDLYGAAFRASSSGQNGGHVFLFDDPATYEKQNTDTLRIGLVSTWARA